ncbi:hypothetical protein PMZ80_000616 [Knufia obscura]|uniref:Gfd2/YDR514C-like C-terminal domain-containing protein n=1 Tax=Knufia obscura TaxID=1635080 RepID=A0ABR0S1W3_9EURO|nr:hypothetical protein PMZ80_000616 [Knufia obscura]
MTSTPIPLALQRYKDEDALTVAVDVEAHCHNRSYKDFKLLGDTKDRRICEVGLGLFDTRALSKITDVGDRGFNLAQHIEAHDSRSEKLNMTTNFLFGSVTWIWKNNLEREIVRIINKKLGVTNSKGKGKGTANKNTNLTHRKVIFLFFDYNNDLKWLAEHGVNLSARFPNSEIVDIQKCGFSQIVANNLNQSQLGCRNLLLYLGLPSEKKHNGGNDAVFEMQGWIAGLCFTDEQRAKLEAGYKIEPVLPKYWAKDFSWSRHLNEEDVGGGSSLAASETTATPLLAEPSQFPALTDSVATASNVDETASMVETFAMASLEPTASAEVGSNIDRQDLATTTQDEIAVTDQVEGSSNNGKRAARVANGRKKQWTKFEL